MTQPEPTRDPRLLTAKRLADLAEWREVSEDMHGPLIDELLAHIAAQENMLVAFRQAAVMDEKPSDLRSLLIECDSELSAQGHGRPPSPSEHLLDLSRRLRSAYDTRR